MPLSLSVSVSLYLPPSLLSPQCDSHCLHVSFFVCVYLYIYVSPPFSSLRLSLFVSFSVCLSHCLSDYLFVSASSVSLLLYPVYLPAARCLLLSFGFYQSSICIIYCPILCPPLSASTRTYMYISVCSRILSVFIPYLITCVGISMFVLFV